MKIEVGKPFNTLYSTQKVTIYAQCIIVNVDKKLHTINFSKQIHLNRAFNNS